MSQDPRISRLLLDVFGLDFKQFKGNPEGLKSAFFSHELTLSDLRQVFNLINASELTTPFPDEPTRTVHVPASILIGKPDAKAAALLLAQVHGNEPVGLSVMLFAMALAEAELLTCKIYGAIGNDSAARYYWEALDDAPDLPAHVRAKTRTLVGEDEKIDLNRFLPERAIQARENRNRLVHSLLESDNIMLRRGAKLCSLVCLPEVELVFDPHTSRQEPDGIRTINISNTQLARLEKGEGDHAGLLRGVPNDIRVFPAGLLGNLGSGTPKITLKELFEAVKKEKPIPIIGIECGHHENLRDVVPRAVEFFNAMLFNRGFTTVKPRAWDKDDGAFHKYHVEGRLPIRYLKGDIQEGDLIYPVKQVVGGVLPHGCNRVLIHTSKGTRIVPAESIDLATTPYAIYQFKEMEDIAAGQVVMMGVPSGNTFTAPTHLTLLFPTKSAEVYGEQPGMWPVNVGDDVEKAAQAKFGYGIFRKERFVLPFRN